MPLAASEFSDELFNSASLRKFSKYSSLGPIVGIIFLSRIG